MGLGPWRNVATIQRADCDHEGTTTTRDQVNTCSDCGASWGHGLSPPTSGARREVSYPPPG